MILFFKNSVKRFFIIFLPDFYFHLTLFFGKREGMSGENSPVTSHSQMYFSSHVHMLVLGLFNGSFLNGLNVSTILFMFCIVILLSRVTRRLYLLYS